MNNKFLTLFTICTLLATQVISVSAEPSDADFLPLPEELIEPFDQLTKIIEEDQVLITLREVEIETYDYLSKSAKARLKADVADLSTQLITIDTDLRNPTTDDFWQVVTDTKTALYSFHNDFEKLNEEQLEMITEAIYIIHLEKFTDTIKDINTHLDSDLGADNTYVDIGQRMEIVDDHIEQFKEDMSESTWVRLEEKIKQLKESIDESLVS